MLGPGREELSELTPYRLCTKYLGWARESLELSFIDTVFGLYASERRERLT